ncbi:MAG: ABC transporter ATP-binding protein [Rhodospirillales bacterium]|nr:ABC transporter ATP-binding protein [Rhodospirillales bacterium]MCB9995608.1 ABC transporter ATP-binding protein [Rhodospirillales bacterium]
MTGAKAAVASTLLHVEGLEKSFKQGGETLTILKNLSLSIEKGEMVALVGPSGAGKSTLLHMIGLLDSPTAGQIIVNGHEASKLGDEERTKLRREFLGFIYQFHYLQPEFSAVENVIIPQMIAGKSKRAAKKTAEQLLESLGLGHRFSHRPGTLSGGEQQRVAIARALANSPKLLLADEPTGNLDPETSSDVFDILIKLVKDTGIGALIATHNMDLADRMDKVFELKNGRVFAY